MVCQGIKGGNNRLPHTLSIILPNLPSFTACKAQGAAYTPAPRAHIKLQFFTIPFPVLMLYLLHLHSSCLFIKFKFCQVTEQEGSVTLPLPWLCRLTGLFSVICLLDALPRCIGLSLWLNQLISCATRLKTKFLAAIDTRCVFCQILVMYAKEHEAMF